MHKKTVPAVWFQNKLNPAPARTRKPEMLELFESQLAQVAGGFAAMTSRETCSFGRLDDCAPD